MEYIKPERIWLKEHLQLDERWVQERIAEDPTILGLGELVLRDRERMQPRAGRLDLLLQDPETYRRYEVEVQLGETDESHIIRAIEYWDIERKRYPQYDHCGVIIAEEITSRFLNVISLFNGFIPLIAIQMGTYRIGDHCALIFTKVLDELPLGLVEEDEEVQQPADRGFWEHQATKATVAMIDELLEIIKGFDPALEPKYNKYYIGLVKQGRPNNFAIFKPKKNNLRLEMRLERSEELEQRLDEAGLDVMEYDRRSGRYRIRLAKPDIKKHQELLAELLGLAYEKSSV
jgi:predicted transport protein